jgi:hypothetical protein
LALELSRVYILDFIECMIVINLPQNLTTKSVTIDKLVVPSRRPTLIQGLGLDGMRFERIGVDRTRRGDR